LSQFRVDAMQVGERFVLGTFGRDDVICETNPVGGGKLFRKAENYFRFG
jgi:hypothetical protein